MSVPYQTLLHDVGLRMSALAGTQLLSVNAAYDTAVLTSTQFKSVDWPFNSFRDAILMAEAQFAEVAASSIDTQGIGNHPWRTLIGDITGALASGTSMPTVGSGGSRIIGAYGEVVDSVDSKPLSRQPIEDVRRIDDEAWRIYPLYLYEFVGSRIFHTRAGVLVGVCVWNRAARLAAFNGNGDMLLPDTAEAGVAALAISIMVRETAFAEQAAHYAKFAMEALQTVARGGIPSAMPAAA